MSDFSISAVEFGPEYYDRFMWPQLLRLQEIYRISEECGGTLVLFLQVPTAHSTSVAFCRLELLTWCFRLLLSQQDTQGASRFQKSDPKFRAPNPRGQEKFARDLGLFRNSGSLEDLVGFRRSINGFCVCRPACFWC